MGGSGLATPSINCRNTTPKFTTGNPGEAVVNLPQLIPTSWNANLKCNIDGINDRPYNDTLVTSLKKKLDQEAP